MEADSPPVPPVVASDTDAVVTDEADPPIAPTDGIEDAEADTTIHGFNVNANVTVIERELASLVIDSGTDAKKVQCEGSDSGVEVVENLDICVYQRALSANSGNSQDFDNFNGARSCDSSIISCCSNYEEAYNLLVRKNSTLLEDYHRNGDVTSENGSESSSISGSQPRSNRRSSVNGMIRDGSILWSIYVWYNYKNIR